MRYYLDHAATTPMIPQVLEAYTAALAGVGNPSSIHSHGQRAKQVLEESRERVAASLNCDPVEVVFTSGGTEAINAALKGLWWARNTDRPRPLIAVPPGEHHATTDTVEWLETHERARILDLPVDADGRVEPEGMRAALAGVGPASGPDATSSDDVALASVIWANNEVGTVQPIAELATIARERGVPIHSDAVGAFGSVLVDFRASGLDALSVSAHKIGGPVGIGALVLGRSTTVVPLLHGGGQQRRIRSGTQDVAAAVAFAVAAELAVGELERHSLELAALRDRLIAGVREIAPDAMLRGSVTDRLPGNAHFTFPGCEGDSLLFLLDMAGVSVSTGSACTAGVSELSHVLLGMGVPEREARGALRFSLGSTSTDADVDALLAALPTALTRARAAGHSDRTR